MPKRSQAAAVADGPATSSLVDARQVHGPDFVTKKQYAADWLREMIVSGELGPGRRVRQQEVADRLGISATPVREAILQLETEGYLESVPHAGVRVAELADDHRDEVAELRTLLEGLLARSAAQRITDEQIAELRHLEAMFEEARGRADAREMRRINYQLHRFIWTVAARVVTRQVVQALWARVPWRTLDDVAVRGRQSVVEHRRLVKALSSRDPDGAERAMAQHIAGSHAYLSRTTAKSAQGARQRSRTVGVE